MSICHLFSFHVFLYVKGLSTYEYIVQERKKAEEKARDKNIEINSSELEMNKRSVSKWTLIFAFRKNLDFFFLPSIKYKFFQKNKVVPETSIDETTCDGTARASKKYRTGNKPKLKADANIFREQKQIEEDEKGMTENLEPEKKPKVCESDKNSLTYNSYRKINFTYKRVLHINVVSSNLYKWFRVEKKKIK